MELNIGQVEKEFVRILKGFRPNKRKVNRGINSFPFFGAVVGLIFGLVYIFSLRPENIVPLVQGRLGALSPVVSFPVTTTLMGIIVGKLLELLIRRLKKRF